MSIGDGRLALVAVIGAGWPAAGETGAPPAAARVTIAVIPKGTSHVFWQSIHAGAVKAARELDVDVVWRGPLREDDRDAQVSEVEGFVSRGRRRASCWRRSTTARWWARCRAPMQPKIPVVIIDSGLKGEDYVSFVATDNRKGGRLGGEHLAKALGGKGKVVLLRYAEGHDSTNQREEGFLEAMKAAPGIEVVSSNQYGGADVEERLQAERGAALALQAARRRARRRRHLHAQRVHDLRHAARAAGQRLGGQGALRRLRRLRQPGEGRCARARSTRWWSRTPCAWATWA